MCSLFCLLELGNVLSNWSYADTDPHERRCLMFARKRARQLRTWVFCHYELLDEQGEPVDHEQAFFWPYLVQQARALLLYKKQAVAQDIHHLQLGEKCHLKAVKTVLERSLSFPPELWKVYVDSDSEDVSFAWKGVWFGVRELVTPKQGKLIYLFCF